MKQMSDETMARFERERDQAAREREQAINLRKQSEREQAAQEVKNIAEANKRRLQKFVDYYTIRNPRKSKFPPRIPLSAPVRLYRKPEFRLETKLDEISEITISGDNRLVFFDGQLAWFGDLSSVAIDDSFTKTPKSLDYYKSNGFTTLRNPKPFSATFSDIVKTKHLLQGNASFLPSEKTFVLAETSPSKLTFWGQYSEGVPQAISFWKYNQSKLELQNVFSIAWYV